MTTKSKLGRNPLAPKKASKTPVRETSKATRESSVPGFIGNLAAAVVAETVLIGLKTFLLARTTLSRRA